MKDSDIDEEPKSVLQHETDSLKLGIANKNMHKLVFSDDEVEIISRTKQPVLLRKKLIYHNLKEL